VKIISDDDANDRASSHPDSIQTAEVSCSKPIQACYARRSKGADKRNVGDPVTRPGCDSQLTQPAIRQNPCLALTDTYWKCLHALLRSKPSEYLILQRFMSNSLYDDFEFSLMHMRLACNLETADLRCAIAVWHWTMRIARGT
jgi:hypothetical protein